MNADREARNGDTLYPSHALWSQRTSMLTWHYSILSGFATIVLLLSVTAAVVGHRFCCDKLQTSVSPTAKP